MKANFIKNLKFRNYFFKHELSKKVDKLIMTNLLNAPIKAKTKKLLPLFVNLINSKHKMSKAFLKNKCVLTNRNKSVEKKTSISRIALRHLMSFGIVPGYKKSVW